MKSADNNLNISGGSGYAACFHQGSGLVHLPSADGWVVRRNFGEASIVDLSSPYPMFSCANFGRVKNDLEALKGGVDVSLAIRTDAFDEAFISELRTSFDVINPFKTHYIADLSTPWREFANRKCRRYAARAVSHFDIKRVANPATSASLFWLLHQATLNRVNANAEQSLSKATLRKLLSLNEAVLFEASDENGVQGLALYLVYGDFVYAHTLGVTDHGRNNYVIYGLYGSALDCFQNGAHQIDFGGNPGIKQDPDDSIADFKRGWCNKTKTSFICGKVLNPDIYRELCKKSGKSDAAFFPAYRAP